jgi:tRNA A37 methylthiotransferase MiaB
VAAGLAGQVARPVKAARVALLRDLGVRKQREFHAAHLGEVRTVLVEKNGRRPAAGRQGFTDNYIPVRFAAGQVVANQLVRVRLEQLGAEGVLGALVEGENACSEK